MSRWKTIVAASAAALVAAGSVGCAFLFDTGGYEEYSAEGGAEAGAGGPTLQEETEEYLEEESNR